MKIAIPVDERDIKTNVCISFGRSPYFLIYNTKTSDCTFIDNSAIASSGGAGIKASQTLVDHEVDVLITPRCGENAAEVLKIAKIEIYQSLGVLAMDNITAYLEGRLSLLHEIHAGFHNHGGR